MFQNGLVNEVEMLLSEGYAPSLQSMQGIGYKEVIGYLLKKWKNYSKEIHITLPRSKGLGLEDILQKGFKLQNQA